MVTDIEVSELLIEDGSVERLILFICVWCASRFARRDGILDGVDGVICESDVDDCELSASLSVERVGDEMLLSGF